MENLGTFTGISPVYLNRIVEEAPIGIALLRGPELIYEYVNAYFQSFAPRVPLLGRPFGATNWLPDVIDRLKEVWESGIPWRDSDLSLRIERSPGGLLVSAHFSVTCIKVDRGALHQPDALLGFVRETTAEVALASGARRRAAELEIIIDTMLEGVAVFDRDRHVTLINQAARGLLRLGGATPATLESAGSVVAALDGQLPDGRHLATETLPVTRALAGEPTRSTVQFFNHATQRPGYVSIGAAPIRDDEGNVVGAVSVASDVSELTELDRLKDEFIRVMAHELKTPITVLKGYATVLSQALGPGLSPEHARMLQAIDRNTERLARLFSELIDAQQISLGCFEIIAQTFDLASLVEEAVGEAAAKAPRHRVRIVWSEPIAVFADPERMRELMQILLGNAVRYSPNGGDIDVSLAQFDSVARVSVLDHGIGIPRDRQDRIFQRFYRAHTGTAHDYGGTGLGLYVARTIVERHGGTIALESDEGRGSVFTFGLPIGNARH